MTLLVLPVAIPAILYIVLSFPGVQQAAGKRAESELTNLLGSDVRIGSVAFSPFNRLVLKDVRIDDSNGVEALHVGHLGAGINLWETLFGDDRIVISYAEILNLDLKLYRDSACSPLNIQPIIDRFKKKDDKGPSKFDLAVNLVVIRQSEVCYDVLATPDKDDDVFDPNHLRISDIRADLRAPRISNDFFNVELRRMGAVEKSGLVLSELSAAVTVGKKLAHLNDFSLSLPNSRIALADLTISSPLAPGFSLSEALESPLATLPDSYVTLSDLESVIPAFRNQDARVDVNLDVEGSIDSLEINRFDVSVVDHDTWVSGHGLLTNVTKGAQELTFDFKRINVNISVPGLLSYLTDPVNPLNSLYPKLLPFSGLGTVNLLGDLSGSPKGLDFNGSIDTDCGNIDIDCGLFRASAGAPMKIDGVAVTESFNPSGLLPALSQLTDISFDAHVDLALGKKGAIDGTAQLSIPAVVWKGFHFTDISTLATFLGQRVEGEVASHSSLLDFSLTGGADLHADNPATEFFVDVRHLLLAPFVQGKYSGYALAFETDASLKGRSIDDVEGWVKISDVYFGNPEDKELRLSQIDIEAAEVDSVRSLTVRSEHLDADLTGTFTYRHLAEDVLGIVNTVYPSLLPPRKEYENCGSDFAFDMTIKEDSVLSRFFNLPIDVIYPATVHATADADAGLLTMNLDAPYLRKKDKLVEGTSLSAIVNSHDKNSVLTAHTSFPTKNGMLDLRLKSQGEADSIYTGIRWKIDRKEEFSGDFDFNSIFRRDVSGTLLTSVQVIPTHMIFNDSVWNVNRADIMVAPGRIDVKNLGGYRGKQYLGINGIAAADSTDRLVVSLHDIDLDYIFETLNIGDAVMFGGQATGDFYGSALLSKEPVLYTPRLNVKGLKYNFCEMGDGDIRSAWHNETKSITIDAVISQANGGESLINGFIKPFTEELDFKFSARKAPVGFMLPFMSAFTSQISGEVSGDAHLFGTFKDLDMTGDIFVKDLNMKLDFTNVTYTTTDSIHITPGLIKFEDVVLKDPYGHTASLSGYVKHRYFHDPAFKFNVTKAKDLLVYDVGENTTEDPWYGRIFGNGGAVVTGEPGKVDINVSMSTAAKSTFTFVLSDAENATEYDFITFRDRDAARKDSIAALNAPPLIVRQLRERIKKQEEGAPSLYAMEFNVDITPAATMNLIMDPVGGDKIVANGSGHLRMTYNSDGDLRMYGDYTLDRGSYNFTLQDIIIKDFTIREGSRISFLGDPYAAQLNIEASYTVNANLSDLDESFLEDRELNRTNVPVNALLMVRGDMRQPDISFDLEFPTLTRDTYRKVRSIVSTEEMMNRQIIYLLALNRFYTPDYMSTTHGNELVSVASSTLSSRLSSMLGQLSDNWSIAPTIRSDRGDFSDVEVDVALSSHLLNNRLLFNGNFGYRDKSLNNNSFIGDFDIRYRLNRAGTIQLKAYNRYNDQNYYLKSALTTQGVGLVFKRDFDNFFSFLRRKKKPSSKPTDEDRQQEPALSPSEQDSIKGRNENPDMQLQEK